MALARQCIRCKRTFLAKKDERYCKHCAEAELLAIINKNETKDVVVKPISKAKAKNTTVNPEPRLATCRKCGELFEQNKRGRPSVNCPSCRAELTTTPKNWPKKNTETKERSKTMEETTVKEITIKQADIKELPVTADKPQVHDAVNHPSHYTRGKIEVIDFIEDQQLPYHLGNVVKYVARAGYKGDKLEDLKKARWYLDRYINEVMK